MQPPAGSGEWLPGWWFCEPRPVAFIGGTAITGHVVLYGYSVKESTGGAGAELDIVDGTDSSGTLGLPITLTAGQSAENWFGPQGIHFVGGIFPNVTTGSVKGSLFIANFG